jgi:hypothetical protein
MTSYITRATTWLAARIAAGRSYDRGAISTETALVTFLLAGVAIAIVAAISTYAEGIVDSLPTPGG